MIRYEIKVQKKAQGLNLAMVYAPNFVENSGLTVTSLSVILRSENGFESKSPEKEFQAITF